MSFGLTWGIVGMKYQIGDDLHKRYERLLQEIKEDELQGLDVWVMVEELGELKEEIEKHDRFNDRTMAGCGISKF